MLLLNMRYPCYVLHPSLELVMQDSRLYAPNPNKYDIATEVLSSAVRVLLAVGFSEDDVPKLFGQVAKRSARGPVWIEPV